MNDAGMGAETDLKGHAASLARLHRLVEGGADEPDCVQSLKLAGPWFDELLSAAGKRPVSEEPDLSWVLDNDYQVRRALRQLRKDMPAGFFQRLPALADTEPRRLPRMLVIACELLSCSRWQLDTARLTSFLDAYQAVRCLRESELCSLPALLRLACLDALFGALVSLGEVDASGRHRGSAPRTSLIDPPRDAHERQERIGNSVSCLIAIRAIDWNALIDSVSEIEHRLQLDPADCYGRMDHDSRYRYRKVVEQIAEHCSASEADVAQQVLELSRGVRVRKMAASRTDVGNDRRRHVGFWLIDTGRVHLEARLQVRYPWVFRVKRRLSHQRGFLVVLALILSASLAMTVPAACLVIVDAEPWMSLLILTLSLMPASFIAGALVNALVTRMTTPQPLPALDFRDAIAPTCPVVVVIPVIVPELEDIPALLERLETHYLANIDPQLSLVLLSDPADADQARLAGDAPIEQALQRGVQRLNEHHPRSGGDAFFLLHRARSWNDLESCWMGWERTRGKLVQFSELVQNGCREPFVLSEGGIDALVGTRFVITLDTDTLLPPGTAARLVGMLAHPLNRAVFEPYSNRVVAGYTVLQPRVETLVSGESSSLFARLLAGDSAIDIHSHAVSDVYQDLFGTGSYVGKGIYAIDDLHRSLSGRVPPGRILSHGLFEGLHGRVGLVTDVVLYDSFPATYAEYASRQHRWIRGNWQLLPWLSRTVPGQAGERLRSVFKPLDRWKLIDNLRRSLLAPTLLLYFLGAWFVFPGSAWVWTLLAAGAFAPYLANEAFAGIAALSQQRSFAGLGHRTVDQVLRIVLSLAFLVGDAGTALDAIARTVWRLTISGQHLLQWTSAARARQVFSQSAANLWRLWFSPVFALTIAALLGWRDPAVLIPAAPILTLWLLSPLIAWRTSLPRGFRRELLDTDDQRYLRLAARRTWHYFDTFAGPADHWLPPDNYQSWPRSVIAHRTSPTNIGLYLCATVTARDLGFIGHRELSIRIRNVLGSLQRMPTYRGHWLNWYDTTTLAPLAPRYVSTVDSGNLAVCLLAVRAACREQADAPLLACGTWQNLTDLLGLFSQAVRRITDLALGDLDQKLQRIEARIAIIEACENGWYHHLATLVRHDWPATELIVSEALAGASSVPASALAELQTWIERTGHYLQSTLRDIDRLLPWVPFLEQASEARRAWVAQIIAPLSVAATLRTQLADSLAVKTGLSDLANAAKHDASTAKWLDDLIETLAASASAQTSLLREFDEIAQRTDSMAYGMDFSWLYDSTLRLLSIGYNLDSGLRDDNHYDLLASEARIASLFAIAKRDVPVEHWFHLGRPLIRYAGRPAARSWSGSMFEYLMPSLFFPGKRDTLLGETALTAVCSQREHARRHNLPWGVSEAAFAATDADGNYQYQAFGTPPLGIRRGLVHDQVIAPYASMLALAVLPGSAVANLKRIEALGGSGQFGFIEAIDFTPERLSGQAAFEPVWCWMAHHQGMSLVAIDNALHDDVMPRRVLSDPRVQAVSLLLQERLPWDAPVEQVRAEERVTSLRSHRRSPPLGSWVPDAPPRLPQVQLLGNGRLSARVTRQGSSALFHQHTMITRSSIDPLMTDQGCRVHVHVEPEPAPDGDLHHGGCAVDEQDQERCDPAAAVDVSTGWWLGQPLASVASAQNPAVFASHQVELVQRNSGLLLRQEIFVAAFDDVEIRRITLTNERDIGLSITLTSHADVALATPADYERHPAFSKLFIGSTRDATTAGLLFKRRPHHDADDAGPILLHCLAPGSEATEVRACETDRLRWLGRAGLPDSPRALRDGLSNSTGFTLDPVMALQLHVTVPPGTTRSLAFLSIVGDSVESVQGVASDMRLASLERHRTDAAARTRQEVQRLQLDPELLPLLQNLASLMLYPHPALRRTVGVNEGVGATQPLLWRFGISGDLPILLLLMNETSSSALLDTLLRIQPYWRQRGLTVDLVVLRSGRSVYEEPVKVRIMELLRDTGSHDWQGRAGGVHLVADQHLSVAERRSLMATALLVLDADTVLARQLETLLHEPLSPPLLEPLEQAADANCGGVERPTDLLFDNGLAGFDEPNAEYVIHLPPACHTPSPWCNVLANASFGSVVSDSGLGFSWAINSGEHRLTAWSNDAVTDRPAEMIYLRDEASGALWNATTATDAICQVRHGMGYTRWLQHRYGLEQELLCLVPEEDPLKLMQLTLINHSDRQRRITTTAYVEWLLGALPSQAGVQIACAYDSECQAILAKNDWNPEFAGRLGFVSASHSPHSVTGDRRGFIGPDGNLWQPEALRRSDLGGRFVDGNDTCAGYQVHLDIPPGATVSVTFMLGEASDRAEVVELLDRWRTRSSVHQARQHVERFWKRMNGAVKVRTPDRAFDLMINHWLIYQNLSSRVFARAGFYQAGGGFGFRDQLQDMLALIAADPERVRVHLLRAAAHQFEAGDVLHWWHPPSDRGVRTRCSDDYLWLVYATARYIDATGDTAVLDAEAPCLQASELERDEEDRYTAFESGARISLYEHCLRALGRMMPTGAHGLPLMGTGDWNDGMDRVGREGRGESVWLAWFQIEVLRRFTPIAEARGDTGKVDLWNDHARTLRNNIDEHAWDGQWYLRAFDDDGLPWGSASNDECRIDAIAQAWSVLAAPADFSGISEQRARTAVGSAVRELVDTDLQIVKLLAPSFHDTARDPGYIKAYPPGVRENGGQYTHGAAWLALACARLGEADTARDLFHMLAPVHRAADESGMQRFRREPYVLSADIGGPGAQAGQGGWSWYTGAAGWVWQLGVHGMLGIELLPDGIQVKPCLPTDWESAEFDLVWKDQSVSVRIERTEPAGMGEYRLMVDGEPFEGSRIYYLSDEVPFAASVPVVRHDSAESATGRASKQAT